MTSNAAAVSTTLHHHAIQTDSCGVFRCQKYRFYTEMPRKPREVDESGNFDVRFDEASLRCPQSIPSARFSFWTPFTRSPVGASSSARRINRGYFIPLHVAFHPLPVILQSLRHLDYGLRMRTAPSVESGLQNVSLATTIKNHTPGGPSVSFSQKERRHGYTSVIHN